MKNIFVIILSAAAILLLTLPCSAEEVIQEWVAAYDGSEHYHDKPIAVKADAQGNVYVAGTAYECSGSCTASYTTIKYNKNGTQLWKRVFDTGDQDYAYAMAVDASGNVLVTGASKNPLLYNGYDVATVKYDTDGNVLWSTRYPSSSQSSAMGYAITSDASGNVYVTGVESSSYGVSDFLTIKYDSTGELQWHASYDAGNSVDAYGNWLPSQDAANDIAVDDLGNVYVRGVTWGGRYVDPLPQFTTIKYDSQGTQLWLRSYPAPGYTTASSKTGNRLRLDKERNVFIAGTGYLLIKYDTNGNELWASQYDHPDTCNPSLPCSEMDYMADFDIGPSGYIYMTGFTGTQVWVGNLDLYCYVDYDTVKFDPDGAIVWNRRYGSSFCDKATALAIDRQENIYVTGASGSGIFYPIGALNWDYATLKYDSQGNQLWLARYDGWNGQSPSWSDWRDWASGIFVDFAGNVYVTGQSSRATSDYVTIKYSQPSYNVPPIANAGPDQTVVYDSAINGAHVTLNGSGSYDPDNDPLTYRWTWQGGNAEGVSPTVLLPKGKTEITLVVDDGNGGTATDTVLVTVAYSFGGFQTPLTLNKPFKFGSTIPVKFRLLDANGSFVINAHATISLVQIVGNEPAGDPIDGTTNVPDSGNIFRYDLTADQYIFNLSTDTLLIGTWRATVVLDDGTSYSADIMIK